MKNLIAGVKKLSSPMFIVFALSKIFVGIGIGVLLVKYLAPYGWFFLEAGVVFSLVCVILAAKNV